MDVMNMEEEMVLRSLDPGQRSAGSRLEYRGSNVSWQHVLECGGSNLGWHRARSFHPLDSKPIHHADRSSTKYFQVHLASHFTMFSQYVLQNA